MNELYKPLTGNVYQETTGTTVGYGACECRTFNRRKKRKENERENSVHLTGKKIQKFAEFVALS
jgi:hypothetical protein